MNSIEYEEDSLPRFSTSAEANQPMMVRWLLKHGVKDPKVANRLLLGVAVCCVVLSLLVLFFGNTYSPAIQPVIQPIPAQQTR